MSGHHFPHEGGTTEIPHVDALEHREGSEAPRGVPERVTRVTRDLGSRERALTSPQEPDGTDDETSHVAPPQGTTTFVHENGVTETDHDEHPVVG